MVDLGRIVEMRQRKLADHERAERQALAHLGDARAKLQDARAAMKAYAAEVATIERDMLSNLIGKDVSLDDIRMIEETLREVEERAKALSNAHESAKKRVAEAEQNAARRRLAREHIQAKLNKISEIDTVLTKERRAAARAAEDAEMDGFVDMIAGRGRG
ncbi:MAG: hypothetical protein AAGC57_14685 [Pseudomonadota bacterium]